MLVSNVRTYNIHNAIKGLRLIADQQESDTQSGIDFYGVLYLIAKNQAIKKHENSFSELKNIILFQDKNELCEYCSIGPQDMDFILSLSPELKQMLREQIVVNMTISADEIFWNWFPIKNKQQGQTRNIVISYQDLNNIVTNYADIDQPDLNKFMNYIACLPYAKILIF